MNTVKISNRWFDFVVKNKHKVTLKHTAVFFLCLEINNRMGNEDRFTLRTDLVNKCFADITLSEIRQTIKDLASFGFIEIISGSPLDVDLVIDIQWLPMFNYN